MISKEPMIRVGIIEHASEVRGVFNGSFDVGGVHCNGEFRVRSVKENLVFSTMRMEKQFAKEPCFRLSSY